MKITRKQLRQIIRESFDASYDADKYMPTLQRLIKPLKGIATELKRATWGEYTEVVHREIDDAISSLDLVVATLREVQTEYKTGPMGGKLRKRSDTYDADTNTYTQDNK
jgi:hypothetical protein